jgi:hypothetical protein
MADESKIGTLWNEHELDVIVADYFDMLSDDLSGASYVKAKHNAVVMEKTGRTHRSVEFKHQNISAVLDELGLPWIPGYIPKRNYQNAISDAIDRYLSAKPEVLHFTPVLTRSSKSSPFVAAPELLRKESAPPQRLQRLIRKFDPVERDYRNRALGRAGEAFVLEVEHNRLIKAERSDLARKIRWVSEEDGDGAGYDVFSYEPNGKERLIEVKTTNGAARTPFFLTRNECELAAERPVDWCIYRVHLFAREPQIFTVTPPLAEALRLTPETWRARL